MAKNNVPEQTSLTESINVAEKVEGRRKWYPSDEIDFLLGLEHMEQVRREAEEALEALVPPEPYEMTDADDSFIESRLYPHLY